jgi:inorganic pyrophosphatase
MPIDSVEEENVAKLLSECGNKEVALEILKKKSIEEMWLEELDELSQQYNIYRNARIRRAAGVATKKKKLKKIKRVIIKN